MDNYWINGSSKNVFFGGGAGAGGTVWTWAGAGCAEGGPVNVLPWEAAGAGGGRVVSGGGVSPPLRPQPASGSEKASARASARTITS